MTIGAIFLVLSAIMFLCAAIPGIMSNAPLIPLGLFCLALGILLHDYPLPRRG